MWLLKSSNYLLYKLIDLSIAVKQIIVNKIVYYIIPNNNLCRMKMYPIKIFKKK